MKKFLLLAAAAVAAFTTQAAVSDYLTVTIDGKEVTEGAVFDINEYEDFEALVAGMGYQYVAHIMLTNKTSNDVKNKLVFSYTDHPTEAMALDDPKAWGTLQICFNNMVEGNSCMPVLEVDTTVPANKTASYDLDNKGLSPTEREANRKFQVALTVEGSTLTFFVNYDTEGGNSGVTSIVAGDSEAEYFNLQGQRVDNPEKGLYIVKKDGKTSKMMLR